MSLEIAWDRLERPEWEALFDTAPRSALVQSWAWGEAKRVRDGWRPHRALITRDGRPLALVQVLERTIGGVARLGRLNRGPVWLEDEAFDHGTRQAALTLARRRWRGHRLAALALAPEWPEGTRPSGCWRRNAPAWGSAWLDLTLPAETLRKRLDGKWRNMLNAAGRAGLEIAADPALLPWLLDRHRDMLAARGFGATPPDLVSELAAQGWRRDDLLVLQARAEGAAVGGILLARHGGCATYLIGWTGDEGRRRKAGNALLWQAVAELTGRGVRALDLGGIDQTLTPGIAAFKRGMGGTEYRLAGEFIAV